MTLEFVNGYYIMQSSCCTYLLKLILIEIAVDLGNYNRHVQTQESHISQKIVLF